ncbi:MAG: sialidase family protein, partial [Verrucomicrobiota bacterium]
MKTSHGYIRNTIHSLTSAVRKPSPDTLACLIKRTALPALAILLLAAGACVSNAKEPADLLRTWQGIPGLERTSKGRLYVSWFSGGRQEPAVENTVYLKRSDDGGHTFSQPQPMAGPLHGSRCYDPTLWLDPTGRLWFIFNRSNRETPAHGVYARLCEAPDAPEPVWTPEFRVGFDETPFSFRMNKPTVLQNGTWILPVTHASSTTKSRFGRRTCVC